MQDLTNRRFGRLTVLSFSGYSKGQKTIWNCRCDCGQLRRVWRMSLVRGSTQSCGCLQLEKTVAANRKHGLKNARVYRIWSGMKNRCLNPHCKDYPRYGGRGITVCERWHNFANFFEDMGLPPDGGTIEREDNSRGYEPGNCVWASLTAQARNRRSNVLLALNGETMCITEWAERLGVPSLLLTQRHRRGWSDEAILMTPVMQQFSRSQRPVDELAGRNV